MTTILIVDDDPDLRVTARLALTIAGHVVVEAATGDAASELACQLLPDVILCDVHLPGDSGLDVLGRLHKDPRTETIPVILITGSDDIAVMRRGMELGADDFLRKPFTPAEVCASVDARLRKRERLKALADRALAESETRFRAIATAALDAVIMIDAHGAITFWNPAAERIFGYAAGEALGRHFHRLVVPEPHLSAHLAGLARFAVSGEGSAVGRTLALRAVRKDGRELAVELSLAAVPLHGEWHAVGIVRDVTEQQQADLARQRERILHRTILDALPDCIYAKDAEGRKTLSNLADLRSLGATREQEVLGKTDYELLDRGVAQACFADDMRVLKQGETVRDRQELIVNPLGEQRWLETTKVPLRDEAGAIVGLVGIGHDVTHRRQMEEQLRKLSKAVEQSPASVVITDTAGRIEYANPRFCAVTGYALDEVIGQNPRVLKSGDTSPEAYRDLWETITAGGEWRGEFRNRKKNGDLYWEMAVVSPITDDNGTITHFLAVKEDITERKRRERERELLEVQLRQAQKLEAIGQLAAGITHEINTPMQYIGDNTRFVQSSFSELARVLDAYRTFVARLRGHIGLEADLAELDALLDGADVDYVLEEIPTALSQCLDGVEKVSRIVLAMKEFCHPGSAEKIPIDLNHAIENAITVARNEYKYVADVVTALAPDLPSVPGLPGELNQVILNLIVNAAHAIGDVVAASPGTRGCITLATQRVEEWAELRVTDTGTGVPEHARTRIFEPFFTTKPVGKGSGQGLALARSVIVHKHQGDIRFETEVGRGTTFIIRLPLHPDTGAPSS
jgi:two-component system, NtrC family, sensor kinase